MLWRRREINRQITRAMWVLPLLVTGVAHAESATATGMALTAQNVIVDFKLLPSGGQDEAAIIQLLRARSQQLGAAPKTLADVNLWSDQLTDALRQGGFPIGQVLMTDSDWKAAQQSAQARFTVFPGRISQIEIQNKSRVADSRLRKVITHALCGSDTLPGACYLKTSRLERSTQLLQDLPGVALDTAPQFGPGAGVGDVKVVVGVVQKGKPVSANLILDNQGVPSTGEYRMGMSVSANNYFGAGESYAFTLTGTDKKMWTGELDASVPILNDGLRLTGGISRQQYTTNTVTPMVGVATTASGGLLYPFARGLDANVWGGVSYLHSQTSTDMKEYGVSTHSKIDSLRFSAQADNGDRAQQLRTNILSGQGALTLGHQSNDFPYGTNTEANPAGNYAKLSGTGYGTYALTRSGNLFLSGRVNAQVANRNLDPSEKLAAGGPNAVRAYRSDEVSFNDGVIVNAGLYQRVPVASGHQLQFGIFSDYAVGRINHTPWQGWDQSYPGVSDVTNTRTLAGYGASIDWLTPIGATVSASVSKPYGFSSPSWVEPGKKPLQYWLSVTWNH
ncbi:ShlB/FhaC/HecB family hemolysin secretion/activation protein [Paraburkholderia terrae]|uniref:ShlB/FhaC/HecB family hemolysin secretion/activation protein n=1 Tax=Paraburkholderia terrae TaxID=311230 RepID=UPI001EE2DB8A|nr:ShlB/FhaC/HecB family hemolysin secretion/activation protein [Paraburkholderia terrae]